jgi:response regulator RpfG family c-di-GMP phosphodiesterase
MADQILLVDDEPNILTAFVRQLRGFKHFSLVPARSGQRALEIYKTQGPFSVAVTDLSMPGMNGLELIRALKAHDESTVCIMLTGNADLSVAIEALNEGQLFRFLTKPCSTDALATAINDGIKQYRLVQAERDLLEGTLNGSVKVLTEILSIIDPVSFGRGLNLRDRARPILEALMVDRYWDIELAAMLLNIGYVVIPRSTMIKVQESKILDKSEEELLARSPQIGKNLLANIPRLGAASNIVLYQNKHYDGSGFPDDGVKGAEIPLGSRILKILTDLEALELQGVATSQAYSELKKREGFYDPDLLEDIEQLISSGVAVSADTDAAGVRIAIEALQPGQRLLTELRTLDGVLLLSAGKIVSPTLLERIKNYARVIGIQEPILVAKVEN